MSKLIYESPVSEINEFATADVVTTSFGGGNSNNLFDGDSGKDSEGGFEF